MRMRVKPGRFDRRIKRRGLRKREHEQLLILSYPWDDIINPFLEKKTVPHSDPTAWNLSWNSMEESSICTTFQEQGIGYYLSAIDCALLHLVQPCGLSLYPHVQLPEEGKLVSVHKTPVSFDPAVQWKGKSMILPALNRSLNTNLPLQTVPSYCNLLISSVDCQQKHILLTIFLISITGALPFS